MKRAPLTDVERKRQAEHGRRGARIANRSKAKRVSRPAKRGRAANPFANLDTGKDFVPVALAYARHASTDTETTGVWIRYAAIRFLRDYERAGSHGSGFTFDPRHANRACRFIEKLPHVEGRWESPTIQLVPAQVFFVVALFGFRNDNGGRRFTVALFAVARKNAKSTLAAGIMLYVLCEENEPGAQLYAAATTGDQAKVVYRIAKSMIERCHELQQHYGVEPYANHILRPDTNSFFKPINARASTQDGLNPQAFVLDELHAHKTHDLMNVLTSASGARANPLFIYTTTEGYETPGPWPEVRTFAQNILRGVLEADHFLALIFAVDEEDKALGVSADNDFDETKWIKANPLYPTNALLRAELKKSAAEAKGMPGKLGEFRIKKLNRASSAAKAWIDLRKWNKCGKPVDPEFVRGHPCWGAFDLSSTTDMTSRALLWYIDGEWFVDVKYWVPENAVHQRTERRSAPYEGWINGGFVRRTEGDVVDYDVVEVDFMEDIRTYSPTKIAYDPWNAQQFSTRLANQGVELEVFVQGPKSYHPAMQALEVAYTTGALRHGGNPVLRWNAGNIVPRYDVNLNMAPDRKRSADKIDGIVCVLMAFGIAIRETGDDSNGFFSAPVRS